MKVIFFTLLGMLSFRVCCIKVNIAIATQFVMETRKTDALRYFVFKNTWFFVRKNINTVWGLVMNVYLKTTPPKPMNKNAFWRSKWRQRIAQPIEKQVG